MPKALNFETGLVEYEINGVSVTFNPTDENFIKRLYDTYQVLEGLQREFNQGDGFDKFIELDAEMRVLIDEMLGEGISDKLFSNMNCYALADGLPVWMNLWFALFYETADVCEREFGKSDARVVAHKKKYNAIMAKYRKGKK